jgi:hypothetical protein
VLNAQTKDKNMRELLDFLREHPLQTILIFNIFISLLLSTKILSATNRVYKSAYATANFREKLILMYSLFSYKTVYATEQGQKYRGKLLISGIIYVVLLILV